MLSQEINRHNWATIKELISSSAHNSELYLSLIDEEGSIESVNEAMTLALDVSDKTGSNFFELIHPVHLDEFKKLMNDSANGISSPGIELYIRNGQYHPMKWQVNYLPDSTGTNKSFLCLGYKILDDKRLERFNALVKNNYQLII